MPCHTVQLNSIDFSITNVDILKEALRAEGVAVVERNGRLAWTDTATGALIRFENGSLKAPEGIAMDKLANQVKRSYSTQVVKTISARMGWKSEVKGSTITATRRSF